MGESYCWSFTGAKIGYDRFDEGLAIFSRHEVKAAEAFYFSNQTDYHNWKSRKAIGFCVPINGVDHWFYAVHMGWWKDDEEPFAEQMDRLHKRVLSHVQNKKERVFLMGDFNSQANIRGEGYDYVRKLGWQDSYVAAEQKDSGITVPGTIDGWTDVESGMRIDYIFSNEAVQVQSSRVVFNGISEPVISDHFGVMAEIV